MSIDRVGPSSQYRDETPAAAASAQGDIHPQASLEEAISRCHFIITARQFAHRLTPAYLEKTQIAGINSFSSATHWIELITLWMRNEALFLPLKISKPDLERVKQVLDEYRATLERYHQIPSPGCQEEAKTTLAEIREEISSGKPYYTPLGYAHGVTNQGHAIPLKVRLKGKQIEFTFLNLGEGAHMHPTVDWSAACPRYNFQSFPILCPIEVLTSEKGLNVFTHLIQLMQENCPAQVEKYSAEDVYGALFTLGKIQSSYDSKISDRSYKSQLGDICGDMAIVLLIRDVLIDLGYKREELQRVFLLEKLCDILFFHHNLRAAGETLDEWKLLKFGIQELSLRGLNICKGAITESEVNFLHSLLHPLYTEAGQQIEKRQQQPLSAVSPEILILNNPASFSFELPTSTRKVHTTTTFSHDPKAAKPLSPVLPPIETPTPMQVAHTLMEWSKVASQLAKNQPVKAHLFVYKALCTLDIPHPTAPDFWDQVPEHEITTIVSALRTLTCLGVNAKPGKRRGLAYQNILILSVGYAITDKLVRRKYPNYLQGFASPFFPSRSQLIPRSYWMFNKSELIEKVDYFDFQLLPLKQPNVQWDHLRYYFETVQAGSSYTLFAVTNKHVLDIAEGVKGLSKSHSIGHEWTPVEEHLKFLEQFLHLVPPSVQLLKERFIELWINKDHAYLPEEIEILYFFALFNHHSFHHHIQSIASHEGAYTINRSSFSPNKIAIILDTTENGEINPANQAALGTNTSDSMKEFTDHKRKKYTENETQCLTTDSLLFNTKTYREWHRIFSNPALQITSSILWLQANIPLLKENFYEDLIGLALFQPGRLEAKITQEPATLTALRSVVRQGIEHYCQSLAGLDSLLFLTRLGICIESYASHPSREALAQYEAHLLSFSKNAKNPYGLYCCLLLLYQSDLPRSEASLRDLIKAHFWISYHEKPTPYNSLDATPPKWLRTEIQGSLSLYAEHMKKLWSDPEWTEQTFTEVFQLLLPDLPLPNAPCSSEVGFPILEKGEYRLNLEEGILLRGCQQLHYFKHSLRHGIFPQNHNGLSWGEGGTFYSTDDILKIESIPGEGFGISRRFPSLQCVQGGSEWFNAMEIAPTFLSGSALAYGTLFEHWDSPQATVIYCLEQKRPLYVALKNEHHKECRVFKVLRDGSLGPYLLNIWDNNHPLAPWFTRLGDIREVCVWVNPLTGQIEEFELILLGLSFKREGERFRSVEYPDFFLALEQALDELDHFHGAIVLENGTKKCAILPSRGLIREDQNFSSQAKFTAPISYRGENLNAFYLYQIDEISGLLVSPEPDENFNLMVLFAAKRNYQKAWHYLQQARTFTKIEDYPHWTEPVTTLQDRSPEALAFYLRFALYCIQNEHQVTLERNHYHQYTLNSIKSAKREFFNWIGYRFEDYLRVHSTKASSRIPSYIRLSAEEENILLDHLKLILNKNDWRSIFDIRRTLLQHRKWSGLLSNQTYSLLAPRSAYQVLCNLKTVLESHLPVLAPPPQPLPTFVRLTEEDLLQNFIPLYERALTGNGEMDIFYLMRSGKGDSDLYAAYVILLRLVHKSPSQFQHLRFGEDASINLRVFLGIVERADTLFEKTQRSNLINQLGSASIHFAYQKCINVSLLPPVKFSPLIWRFNHMDKESLTSIRHEAETYFLKHYLHAAPQALLTPGTPFAFASLDPTQETPTTCALLTDMRKGYDQLLDPQFGKRVYTLQEGALLAKCLQDAYALAHSKRERIDTIKKRAEEEANHYPRLDFLLGLRKMGADLPPITLEGILTQAYQDQDPLIIKKANPSLSSQQIYTLMLLTVEYHLLRIQVSQVERGIAALEKEGSIQLFGECLASPGNFDPTTEPEIFLFQSRTGKSLRPSQADLLQWEIETAASPIRLFSAPAGDGKTTLYLPIAMRRLYRLGAVPLSTSSKALYNVDRDGLRHSAQHIFAFETDVLELALNTEAQAADYQKFYQCLKLQGTKAGFKIIPDVFYALHLKYQLALEKGDEEAVKWLSLILDYFETEGANFVDESRVNCSPFTQAKIGIGRPVSLPTLYMAVFVQIYRALLSPSIRLPDGRSVNETLRLQDNQQATLSKQERIQIKQAVLQYLVHSPFCGIPERERQAVYDYWSGKAGKPQWLQGCDGEEQSRALLIKVYFDTYFKDSMKLVWRMHHVHSIKAYEEIHVTARTRQATYSYFDDPYFTLIATIHGTLQEGLNHNQASHLFEALKKQHVREVGATGRISDIEIALGEWLGMEGLRLHHFSRFEIQGRFLSMVQHNIEVIFWYLEHVLLKQVEQSPETLTVSPIHFLHGFKSMTLFSADPGPEEIYGLYTPGKHIRKDPQFVPHAIHTFLKPENGEFLHFPDLAKAEDFFDSLIRQDPHIFSHLRMVCDVGGLLRNFLTPEIISAFFTFLNANPTIEMDGIIIFEEASTQAVESKVMLQLKEWKTFKILKGQDIPAALSSYGRDWKKLNLLTIIDPSHRVGSNIAQHEGTSVLSLLGEGLTLTDDVQGKLRGRGILSSKQRLIWGVASKLAPAIGSPITPYSSILWEMRNGSKIIDKEILLSAYQQIDYWVVEPLLRQLKELKDKPRAQIALWKRHRGAFVQKNNTDPIDRFLDKQTPDLAENVLWKYAETRFNACGYPMSWAKATPIHEKIRPAIAAVKERQTHLTTSTALSDSMRHTSIHIDQKQEMRKEYICDAHDDLKAEEADTSFRQFSIDHPRFVSQFAYQARPAVEIFGSHHLTPGFRFTLNALHTAQSGYTPLHETYLKQAQYILVVKENNQWSSFALSDEEASFFQQQLLTQERAGRQAALLTANGSLAQNGRGESALTPALLADPYIRDVVLDLGLIRCELTDPRRFLERIEQWDDFWPMWLKIKKWQPLPHQTYTLEIEKLVPAELKKYVAPAPTGFFTSMVKQFFS